MTIFRGTFVDTPTSPFPGPIGEQGTLRIETDGGLLVHDGRIERRGSYPELRHSHPAEPVTDLSGGLVIPGLVDTHVHFPQLRIIGGLGRPLLEWLDEYALPEECRMQDAGYARQVGDETVAGLLASGTTTVLAFGSHFAAATHEFLTAATAAGLRVTMGQVLADRALPEPLLTTPAQALAEGTELIRHWHGRDGVRYAVTPRFALSASDAILEVCAQLQDRAPGIWFTSHLNENGAEIESVRGFFPEAADYLDTYHRHGLVHERAVFAHNVHPLDPELDLLAGTRAVVAHCPSSNAALGSGLFPMRRHLDAGVRLALGSDVGAGTGFCLLKEGLQAYLMQRLLGDLGHPLDATQLLYLATRAGALAVGRGDEIGDLSEGKAFDACWIRPRPGSVTAHVVDGAPDAVAALAGVFTLGSPADIAGVWINGRRVVAHRKEAE